MKGHRIRGPLAIAAGCAALVASAPAQGWEVALDGPKGWRSIYCVDVPGVGTQCRETGSLHGGPRDLQGNEHAEITDDVLFLMAPALGEKLGVGACTTQEKADASCPVVVDLNASWLRRNVLDGSAVAGDDVDTVLEERRLPPIAMWAGLPDFGYTVYDWANKMVLCPSLPPDADRHDLCHEYRAWLGAGLNSTHFGHLPLRIYARYHDIALGLASKARSMRETLRAAAPGAVVWHRQYLEELERLALIYEMAGQHFLEDRWATGHMIARWGPGSYQELPHVPGSKPKLTDAIKFGVLTGILHGSQAVFGHPDPLNAPLLDSDGASGIVTFLFKGPGIDTGGTLSRWRYTVDNKLSPPSQSQGGVGDFLFSSLARNSYSGVEGAKVVPAISLAPAVNQRKGMRYCVAQGMRETIARLGPGETDPAMFGVLGLPLAEPDQAELKYEWVPGAERLGKNPVSDPLCNSQWVTNDAWYMGLRTIAGQTTVPGDIVVVIKTAFEPGDEGYTPPFTAVLRTGEAYARARFDGMRQVRLDQERPTKRPDGRPDYGTELARTSPTFYANDVWWKGNQNYGLPSYYEPADLETLPDLDNQYGRDKAAIFGLFNKAGVDYWCKQSVGPADPAAGQGRLAELRDQITRAAPSERKRFSAVCSYLAQRLHRGTDPAYAAPGPRVERIGDFLPFGAAPKYGADYEPVCALLDQAGVVRTSDATDDGKPYYLHPGYVRAPGEAGELGYASRSLEAWCQRVPVLDIADTSRGRDVVYTLDHTSSRWALLQGRNLGKKTPTGETGQVLVETSSQQWNAIDVWDEPTQSATGGWSEDGKVIYARLPPSGRGYLTPATPSMLPHELLALEPTPLRVRIVRPVDTGADLLEYFADGDDTEGDYHLDLLPQVLQVQWGPVAPGTAYVRAEFCHPKWMRPDIEVLAKGVYRLDQGTYAPLALPFQWYDDIPWDPTPSIQCDPADERAGAEVPNPDPAVFDGNVVFVFAYH